MIVYIINSSQQEFVYQSSNPIWESLDKNNLSFLPKKFNRSKHFNNVKGVLPIFYDEFTWDFWFLPSTYTKGKFFNTISTKFSKVFLKKYMYNYPFWYFRDKFNGIYYLFYSNTML